MVATSKKSKDVALVKEQNTAIAVPDAPKTMSPVEQLMTMKEAGLTPADMKDMLAVQKEYDEMQAEKLFNVALANFKAEDILITKDKTVSYKNNDGTTTGYSHASLGSIVEIAVPFMSKHGLSHRWKTEQGDGGITVTFVLTHIAGHSEETSLKASPDGSGKKNAIQQVSSTMTYLERYTFLAGTGLAVRDQNDDDGQAFDVEPVELISEDQVLTIHSMMDDNELSWDLFWAWVGKKFVGVSKVDDFPANSYDVVVAKVKQSIEAKKKAS